MSNMAPREQIEKASKKYFDDYLNGLKGDTLTVTDTHKAGAEYGYNLALERMEKILEDIDFEQRYLDSENLFDKELFIEELKQAMKL